MLRVRGMLPQTAVDGSLDVLFAACRLNRPAIRPDVVSGGLQVVRRKPLHFPPILLTMSTIEGVGCRRIAPVRLPLPPARRSSVASQSVSLVGTKNGLFAKSMFGLGRSKPSEGGICLWYKASVALIKPATPAAWVRWPMLLLIEPMGQY